MEDNYGKYGLIWGECNPIWPSEEDNWPEDFEKSNWVEEFEKQEDKW